MTKDPYVREFRAELSADLGSRYAQRLHAAYSTLIDGEGAIRDRLSRDGEALAHTLEALREIMDAAELDY